jgi:hypothetical protein
MIGDDALVSRVERMREALNGLAASNLAEVRGRVTRSDASVEILVDFNAGTRRSQLEIHAFALIENIASIKDHLKSWCVRNCAAFRGEVLIDSNKSVAVVHDLWNIDKHATLTRGTRSGHTPKLEQLRRVLEMRTASRQGATVTVAVDPRTGQLSGGGSIGSSSGLVVDAEIVDESGARLGSLRTIAREAIAAWEAELRSAGVSLP